MQKNLKTFSSFFSPPFIILYRNYFLYDFLNRSFLTMSSIASSHSSNSAESDDITSLCSSECVESIDDSASSIDDGHIRRGVESDVESDDTLSTSNSLLDGDYVARDSDSGSVDVSQNEMAEDEEPGEQEKKIKWR